MYILLLLTCIILVDGEHIRETTCKKNRDLSKCKALPFKGQVPKSFHDIMMSTTRRGLSTWPTSELIQKQSDGLEVRNQANFLLEQNYQKFLSSGDSLLRNNSDTKAITKIMTMKRSPSQFSDKSTSASPSLPHASPENIDGAIQNFLQIVGIREDEKVLMLTDPLLDLRVIDVFRRIAIERKAASFTVYEGDSTRYVAVPEDLRPLVANATFVISTWFASVFDPFCQNLRRQHGQRWMKITLFRNLNLWTTPMASFPLDVLGEIVRATQRLYPDEGPFELRITDPRGTDLRIPFSKDMRDRMKTDNRWRGHNTADEDGCYVHYLPVHGPNLYDPFMFGNDPSYKVGINGIIRPQWAVGFETPFHSDEIPEIEFKDDQVVAVRGNSTVAATLRDFLIGGTLEEFGCGHNPKAPRFDIYPAGPNSPGSLHFGINGLKESLYFKESMPDWEEPHVHSDLVCYDCTVRAGSRLIINDGHLLSLDDPKVIQRAEKHGDPNEILKNFPV